MKKLFKKIILHFFFIYCRDEEREIYKNNIGSVMSEVRRAHIRDILTRVSTKELQEAILKSDREYETVISLVTSMFTDKNYYENN